jgi:aminoglycoside phosphotransferase (APT) family kinase protein
VSLELVAELFPQLEPRTVVAIEEGWDSLVLDVDDEWIVRVPRRAQVAEWMGPEIRLLPELAAMLPVPVPRFEHVVRNGVRAVAYRKLPGDPLDPTDVRTAVDLAGFLSALHRFPLERAAVLGVPNWLATRTERIDSLRESVMPRLGTRERAAGETLLEAVLSAEFRPALVHADLGREHVLCANGRITGVLDWTDVRIGDPALDLAWLVGTPLAEPVRAAYDDPDEGLSDRALLHHRLGPWYWVIHGLEHDVPEFVLAGLAGLRDRLPRRIR